MVPFRSSSPRNDVLEKLLAEPEVRTVHNFPSNGGAEEQFRDFIA